MAIHRQKSWCGERTRTSLPRLYGMICKSFPINGIHCVKTQQVSRSSNLLRNSLCILEVVVSEVEGTVVRALKTSRFTTAAPVVDENGMFIWY